MVVVGSDLPDSALTFTGTRSVVLVGRLPVEVSGQPIK